MGRKGTALWQGFGIEWAHTPHRLKHLASHLDRIEVDEAGIRGICRARLTVGKVPDRGVARTRIGGLRSRALRCVHGEVRGRARAAPGHKARFGVGEVVVELPEAAPGRATAVLQGFELACTSHPAGIHPQGISVGLADLRVERGRVRFRPKAWVRANRSPDLVTGWRDPFAFEFRVLYTVLAGPELAISHRPEPCARVEHRRGRGPGATLTHRGQGGYGRAAVGVRGLRWDQRHRSFFGRNGRFLRRLEAWIEAVRYDPATGSCEVEPRLRFSNRGLLPWPTRSEHRLWTTLIEYRDEGPPLEALTVEQPVGNGLLDEAIETTFALGSSGRGP